MVIYTPIRGFLKYTNVQNAVLSWNAQLYCPVALNFLDKKKKEYTDVYVYILYHVKIPCNVWKKKVLNKKKSSLVILETSWHLYFCHLRFFFCNTVFFGDGFANINYLIFIGSV